MRLALVWRNLGLAALLALGLLGIVGAVVAGPDVTSAPRPLSIPGNPTPWPGPDAVSVPATTTISMSYDEAMDAATVSTRTFSVHAMQTGVLTAVYATDGGSMSLTPVEPFKPGELVQVSATTQTLSLSGEAPISSTLWQFRIATAKSTGVFSHTPQSLGAAETYDVVLGDMDGDGDLDLLTGNYEANKLWRNDGSGLFSDSGLVLGSERTNALALGDLDRDGDLDLFSGNGSVYWPAANEVWFNDGHGSLSNSGQSLGITGTIAIALADLDGDGDLDALAGNHANRDYGCSPVPCLQGGGVEVWLNDGSGTYHERGPRFSPETDTQDVATIDVDGDGDLDAVVANSATYWAGAGQWVGGESRVWLNDGSGTFSDSGRTLGLMQARALDVGDVDGDGLPDVILGVYDEPNQVWLNDGLGGFVDSEQRLAGGYTNDVALGDVDGDGDLDIVIVAGEVAFVWVNEGGAQGGSLGHFSDSGQVLAEGRLDVIGFGDLDGDGDLDFAAGYVGEPGPNKIWINNRFAPVAADDSLSVMPNAVDVVLNVLANDADADGDVLDLIAAGEPDRGGTVALSGTTHIRYSSATGYTGPEVFTYTVSDPGGLTDTAVVTVEVGGANDAPVALDDSVSTPEDIALDIAVLANDSDPNGQTLSIAGVSAARWGIATIAGTGVHYAPLQDWHGTDVFAYTVTDGWLTATARITVTVAPVNDPPTLDAIADLTIPEDAPLQRVALTGISSGALNEPQVLTVTAERVLSVIPVPTINYTSPNATAELVFQPVPDEFGVAYVTVAISDGLATTEREFRVTVESVNDAPSFVLPAPLVIDEDAGLQAVGVVAITFGPSNEIDQRPSLTLTATSTDPAVVPHPAITYNNTAGSYSAATLRFTSPPDVYGAATLVVTLTDGISTTTQSLLVTVSPVNDPPSVDALGGMSFSEDGAVQSVALSGIDAGPNESQTLVVTARSTIPDLLPHPTVTYHSPDAAGSLSVVPAADRYGTATVWVTVTDGLAETGRSFPVTIAPVNDAPTMSPIAGIHLDAGGAAQSVPITGVGAGPYESQPLTVTALSSDSVLAALSPVDYTSPAAAGSVTVTPHSTEYGVTTVDVT
ncbi:MAG: tandem-95 repeat protein, partial [Anaerolineae bacterium]|nr:tandem-95 repeat protein [Anaerolineae bacterium]